MLVHRVGDPNYPIWIDKKQKELRIDTAQMKPHEFYYLDRFEEVTAIKGDDGVLSVMDLTQRGMKMHLSRMQK